MATERQIAANRQNAAKSCGPKTEEGKARSRANATTHGMTAQLVEADDSPEFLERRAKRAAEHKPVGDSANWALDRAVAASLRIDRCERAFDQVVATSRERALHSWDEDRSAEAASLASGLARDPVLVSRRLQTSLAGVELLIQAWLGLIAPLGEGRDWSESERSRALDLLGSDPDFRSGRTVVDPGAEDRPIPFRLDLAFGEVERLERLRDESMVPLDDSDRRRALRGDVAMLSKPAKLVLRYEREAWRHYREAMAQVHEPAKAPEPPKVIAPEPAEVVETTPEPVEPESIATKRSQFGEASVKVTKQSQFEGDLAISGVVEARVAV